MKIKQPVLRMFLGTAVLLGATLTPSSALAKVATGDKITATRYYRSIAKELGFSTPDGIFQTTLDDVARYLGYGGVTGLDLQNLPPDVLMNPDRLIAPCADPSGSCGNTLRDRDRLVTSLGDRPIAAEDILASQFFAPKIMNIKEPEATRKLGWRKLVRIRARPGSEAQAHHISSGIVLFNIFTNPGAQPFSPSDESVNTQVMLLTDLSSVPPPGTDGLPTMYWLDYDRLSKGGQLSLALTASFDANELQDATGGAQPYFVPDGCIACHGNNQRRSMVNYLDTDHWFDRLDNDFQVLKSSGTPLLVDAQTNDTDSLSFKTVFDVFRRFNAEADAQVHKAQPKHDEALASEKWLQIHSSSTAHFQVLDRAIGAQPRWSADDPNDVKVLPALNQYCFRCHGTIKFSVFDKQEVHARRGNIKQRIRADAALGERMPPDRDLPDDVRKFLLDLVP